MTMVDESVRLVTPLCAEDTYEAMVARLDAYEPGKTEERLGLSYTSPDLVRLDRLRVFGGHTLLVQNETGQVTNNFKMNGAAFGLDLILTEKPWIQRLTIGSAGNAGAAVVDVALQRGLGIDVFTPRDLVPSKLALIDRPCSTVHADYDDVPSATEAARARADDRTDTEFIHAYDNPDVIAGQGLVARRAFRGLLDRAVRGEFDLDRQPVKVLVQRGGGSLLTGFAVELQRLKRSGRLSDNVQLYEVVPGESKKLYDGLNVPAPGTYAQSVLADPDFVAGSIHIRDEHTSRAAYAMGQRYGRPFEPSGLAGVAGFFEDQPAEEPTIYLTVLSGANYSPKTLDHFRDLPRRQQQAMLLGFSTRQYVETAEAPNMTHNPYSNRYVGPMQYGRTPV